VRALSGSFGVRQALAVDTVNTGLAMNNSANELAASPRYGRWFLDSAAHQRSAVLGRVMPNSRCWRMRLMFGIGVYRNFMFDGGRRRRLTIHGQTARGVVLATVNFDHIGSMGIFVHWHKPLP
jgi:hypothetical protein